METIQVFLVEIFVGNNCKLEHSSPAFKKATSRYTCLLTRRSYLEVVIFDSIL